MSHRLSRASAAFLADLGITYRQLDYWCRSGYLGDDVMDLGQGNARVFTRTELAVLRRMAALVNDGVKVPRAAELAWAGPTTEELHVLWLSERGELV